MRPAADPQARDLSFHFFRKPLFYQSRAERAKNDRYWRDDFFRAMSIKGGKRTFAAYAVNCPLCGQSCQFGEDLKTCFAAMYARLTGLRQICPEKRD